MLRMYSATLALDCATPPSDIDWPSCFMDVRRALAGIVLNQLVEQVHHLRAIGLQLFDDLLARKQMRRALFPDP
jgi:hypothetical protein